ncbi:DUF6609 family protein [Heyndrickxia coagulans]|uniref:DUF6609 family protein n=1 Tax=Heyndrickxia coagulans TaxID=1398 RepID=UPI0003FF7E20
MIWLAAFLSFGIHFFPLAAVYGKIMLPLAVLCSANVIAGMLLPNVPFSPFSLMRILQLWAFSHHHIVFQKRPPIFFTWFRTSDFRHHLIAFQKPGCHEKNGLRNFKSRKKC